MIYQNLAYNLGNDATYHYLLTMRVFFRILRVCRFVNIRSKKRNVFGCKFPRHWLILFILIAIIFLIIMNFVIPYNSGTYVFANARTNHCRVVVYKDLNSNKLRSIKTEPPSAFEQKIPNLVKEPNDNGNKLQDKCEVIHIGFVCSGFKSNLYLHTLLKSLFFYRISPVHFHIIVNKVSERVLKTLFETWNLPQSNVELRQSSLTFTKNSRQHNIL